MSSSVREFLSSWLIPFVEKSQSSEDSRQNENNDHEGEEREIDIGAPKKIIEKESCGSSLHHHHYFPL